jgi:Kdo2-lipid IVA lauroyltransferase/acyltransferase
VFAFRQPDETFVCRAYPPLELENTGDRDADVAPNTQIIMDAIGDRIRESPQQWLWLHDRWRPHDAGK